MKKFTVITRYTSEDIYSINEFHEVIADSAEEAEQMVIEDYDEEVILVKEVK
jgi:hypothetical protein